MGEYGSHPLYKMLGYFSIIGLLRVHVLLGDFTLALKVMDNVELNQKVRPISLIEISETDVFIEINTVAIHTSYGLHCYNLLLRWLLLHDDATIPGCDTDVRHDSQLHNANATIPHEELSV